MTQRALLFAGQGSQAVGMGRDLAEQVPACRELFERASGVLGYDLAKICFEGPLEELTRSCHAQPAIFTVSVACLAALRQRKPEARFAAAAGLSSGEWTALFEAGVLSFEDTLRVLDARGRFMQEACEARAGGMLAVVGLEITAVSEVAAKAGVEVANLNSPEQTILSGPVENIAMAEPVAKAAGAKKVMRLNVAGAFHSSLMQPAADKLAAFLAGITFLAPQLPVISNVTGRAHDVPDSIRQLMVRQVTSSVRWVDCVQALRASGVSTAFECGPGKVLSGLVKRIDKDLSVHNISDLPGVEAAVAMI